MPGTHHKYSPSSAERLVNCPGSVRMQDGFTELESEYAAEGTDLHEIVESFINDEMDVDSERFVSLSLEQREAVTSCVAFAKMFYEDEAAASFHTEVKLDIYDGFMKLTDGSADLVVVYKDGTAAIIDWKFGRRQVPYVRENFQFALYSAGVAQKFRVTSVAAHVYQPRIRFHDKHTFTQFDAIAARYAAAIKRAEAPELVLKASRTGCRYCKAIGICPAASKASEELEAIEDLVGEYGVSVNNAADYWDICELAQQRAKAIKSEIMKQALGGAELPGLRLVEKQGNRKITDNAHLINVFADLGIQMRDVMSVAAIPIGKAEKLFVDAIRKQTDCNVKFAKESFMDFCGRAVTRAKPSTSIERTQK